MTSEKENTPTGEVQAIVKQLDAFAQRMEARGWPVCRLCGTEQARVDEYGDCGLCRAKLQKRRRRLGKWAEMRRLKGMDQVGESEA